MVQQIERNETEKIFVVMENGKIQKVLSESDAEVVVINYDVANDNPTDLMEIEGKKASVSSSSKKQRDSSKTEAESMRRAIDKGIEKREEKRRKQRKVLALPVSEKPESKEQETAEAQMHSAIGIATSIIKTAIKLDMPVTHIHVQKMMYILQGMYLAEYGCPLFEEPIARWTLGPVIPAVHSKFIVYGMSPIRTVPELPDAADMREATGMEADMIEEVVQRYAKEDVFALIEQTKQHRIYKAEKLNTLYTDEELRVFFANEYPGGKGE